MSHQKVFESCHTKRYSSHVTPRSMESCHTKRFSSHVTPKGIRVMSHQTLSHVTPNIESCHTKYRVMSHQISSHVTPKSIRAMPHQRESSHVTQKVFNLCHTKYRVMSHQRHDRKSLVLGLFFVLSVFLEYYTQLNKTGTAPHI